MSALPLPVLVPQEPSPVEAESALLPVPPGTVPFVIMRVYYKHGDSDMLICNDDAKFMEAVNEHVAELRAYEPEYKLKKDSTLGCWLHELLQMSKEIMHVQQGGHAWIGVVHGSAVYTNDDYEIQK